jgi:hypothetical protein
MWALMTLALILLGGGATPHPVEGAETSLPNSVTIPDGLIIAHGNELNPPYTLTARGDTLSIIDGAGRHFANAVPPSQNTDQIPIPRLLAAPGLAAPANPEIRLAQIAHLLGAGGVIAFGSSYLIAFPPASAATLLPDLRWVAENAVIVSGQIPQASPFFRDLMWPVELAPPAEERMAPAPSSSEVLERDVARPFSS